MEIAVIGSTGSIGVQTLDCCRRFPDRLQPVALAGGHNQDLLIRQIQEFRPKYVASATPLPSEVVRDFDLTVLSLTEMAALPELDRVMLATSGRAGLEPAFAALQQGTDLVIANKEVLVMAGELVCQAADRSGARLLPVDSEHNAVWQCLQGDVANYRNAVEVERVLLTASGGAFRHLPVEELAGVTVEQALKHPNWVMGPKVTIDSATLMNKGFEVIETHWLFQVPYDRIEIVLHRESLIHSMVEFGDGAVKAQISPPDMRLPIQYALSYPDRWTNPALPRMDFTRAFAMHFDVPTFDRYPCLQLALDAGRRGGTWTTVLSAADEWAVAEFIAGRIAFTDIPRVVEAALDAHSNDAVAHPALDQVLAAEQDTIARLQSGSFVAVR
jgi:1-deoxy-D-xylulose-5-phosphate reductoisomerase